MRWSDLLYFQIWMSVPPRKKESNMETVWFLLCRGYIDLPTSIFFGCLNGKLCVDVSKNHGTPKSSILIRFSIIKDPFWGTPIFGNTHVDTFWCLRHDQSLQVNRVMHDEALSLLAVSPPSWNEQGKRAFQHNQVAKETIDTWIFLLCVKFVPVYLKNLPILAEILHIWKIQ